MIGLLTLALGLFNWNSSSIYPDQAWDSRGTWTAILYSLCIFGISEKIEHFDGAFFGTGQGSFISKTEP